MGPLWLHGPGPMGPGPMGLGDLKPRGRWASGTRPPLPPTGIPWRGPMAFGVSSGSYHAHRGHVGPYMGPIEDSFGLHRGSRMGSHVGSHMGSIWASVWDPGGALALRLKLWPEHFMNNSGAIHERITEEDITTTACDCWWTHLDNAELQQLVIAGDLI